MQKVGVAQDTDVRFPTFPFSSFALLSPSMSGSFAFWRVTGATGLQELPFHVVYSPLFLESSAMQKDSVAQETDVNLLGPMCTGADQDR